MDGAHSRSQGLDTALGTRSFRLLGAGRDGLDARRAGPERLRGAVRPDGRTRGRTPGAARPPAAFRCTLRALAWGWVWWTKPCDPLQDAAEQLARHRHLRHLEDHVAAMGDHLRADLHHLLPQRGQRPPLDLTRQRQGAQEVGQVVGQRVKLEADALARNVVHDSRVHLTACLPSLIHCSAVPRPL